MASRHPLGNPPSFPQWWLAPSTPVLELPSFSPPGSLLSVTYYYSLGAFECEGIRVGIYNYPPFCFSWMHQLICVSRSLMAKICSRGRGFYSPNPIHVRLAATQPTKRKEGENKHWSPFTSEWCRFFLCRWKLFQWCLGHQTPVSFRWPLSLWS